MKMLALLLLLPSASFASTVAPESDTGQRIVHRLADKASRAFLTQASLMQGKGEGSPELADCEAVRAALLEDFGKLELASSTDLKSAKDSLEKGSCSDDARKSYDRLFAVTLSLRASDKL